MPSPADAPQPRLGASATETTAAGRAPGDQPFASRFRVLAILLAGVVTAAALAGIFGWVAGMPGLLGVPSGTEPMRIDSGLALALGGIGVLLRLWGRPLADRMSVVVGVLVMLLGGVALLQATTAIPSPAHWPHALVPQAGAGPVRSGAMTPLSAGALLIAGGVLARGRWRRPWTQELAAAAVMLVGLVVCVAYVVGVRFVHDPLLAPAAMALSTAWATALLGTALVLMEPHRGWVGMAASESAGGYMARRLAPAALLLPVVVGLMARAGQQAEHYGDDLKLAIVLVASIGALSALTVGSSWSLHRLDRARRSTQRRLEEREVRLAEALRREREARARAQEADRRKDEFLAILGHELRNPLSPILTALQLLRLKGLGTDEEEWEVIDRQARHLSRLVDDLLDVSRVATGRVALQREPVELARVVERAIEMTAPLVEERRHLLLVTVPEHGLVVDADEGRLAQVVSNLLANAAKYTDPGGAITVHAEATGGEVVLTIVDNGQGIDPGFLPHLFDRFVQAPRPIDRSNGGLGIGLAIVRSLVELHGGTVTAQSDGPGTGSEFIVRLPRATRPMSVEAPARAPVDTPSSQAHRVLVVDDNRDAADILALALQVRGHVVQVAYDGPSALEQLDTFEPEVALLDIGLPAMDGYALAERIRRHPHGRHTHLIAVTGYSRPSDRRRSLQAGFELHLVKPIDPTAVDEHIRAVVEGAAPKESPAPSPVGGPGAPPRRGLPPAAR